MRYISTRGQTDPLDFENALLAGLASDGGLYVPETLPSWDADFLRSLRGKSYEEIAFAVIAPFVAGTIPDRDLVRLISESYAGFNHPARAPLVQIDVNEFVLELHRGPTLAFKDFAMQLVAKMMGYVLERRKQRLTIIGATSGDTGSAAIEAFKGLSNVDVFILFPEGRVSPFQQRQMTTSGATNVYPLAVKGDFDDCQALVKASFNDHVFRDEIALGGVNSINWGRVLCQIVYYVSASLDLGAPERAVSFSVPTGNFGDIYAGYLARKMGLPIDQLIIATNQNDILYRTVETGAYTKTGVTPSISPSMDIQVSSNFERLLFDLHDGQSQEVVALMEALQNEGEFVLQSQAHTRLQSAFSSARASEEETRATIKRVYDETGELLCPHTAVGVHAARAHRRITPMVILATAHAAKFGDAVKSAVGFVPPLPENMSDIYDRTEKFELLENDLAQLQNYVRRNLE